MKPDPIVRALEFKLYLGWIGTLGVMLGTTAAFIWDPNQITGLAAGISWFTGGSYATADAAKHELRKLKVEGYS